MAELTECKWVSAAKEHPPAEGWYLVRFETRNLSTRIAMHYRPKQRAWFIKGGPCSPWGGMQPLYWLNVSMTKEQDNEHSN